MVSHRKLGVRCKMWGSRPRGSGSFQQWELLWGQGLSKKAENKE